jgi:hypothetical protein
MGIADRAGQYMMSKAERIGPFLRKHVTLSPTEALIVLLNGVAIPYRGLGTAAFGAAGGITGLRAYNSAKYGPSIARALGEGAGGAMLATALGEIAGTEVAPRLLGMHHGLMPDSAATAANYAEKITGTGSADQNPNLEKESQMSTPETLFNTAAEVLDSKVRTPMILSKLASRGYKAETAEQAAELLKHAEFVAQKVAAGEIAPVPASHTENGELTKAAADKASQDFLAFAPAVTIDVAQLEPVVKEAAAVLAAGFTTSQAAAE